MSHIKDRLIQLKNEVENTGNGAYFSKNNISKIVELLLTDLEQDEKENGWIPVSERLPEKDGRYLVTFKNGIKVCMVGYGSCKRTVLGYPIGHGWYSLEEAQYYAEDSIIAWRPIPNPMKEDDV
jgi:hypothetical protein|nr:MAG TPA: Protein of unknown function (DUF551) [Caudoviricetes sp.]